MSDSPPSSCDSGLKTHCAVCHLSALCLPISLQLEDVNKLEDIVRRGRPLHKGQRVYHAGAPFHSIYAVRSGAIKTVSHTGKGSEQITGFYLPGEVIGLDGLANNVYANSAIALSTCAVCEIPFSRLEELSMSVPTLRRRFVQLMSREIGHEQQLITLLSQNSAVERIAALLLSLSARHGARGLSATDFDLPMSRSDIGNFLGLTIETVSRILGNLSREKLIDVDKKRIRILEMDRLKELSFM